MLEKWIGKNIAGLISEEGYYIELIKYGVKGLEFILSYDKNPSKIKVKFPGSIESYRYYSNDCSLELRINLKEKRGKNFVIKHHYFVVENSEYLKWLDEESCTITTIYGVKHYAFAGINFILDVVAFYEPEFEIVKCN